MLKKLDRKWVIVAIIVLAVSIRLHEITMPLLEGCVARQIICADVARNMFRDGEFLKPKVSILSGPRLYLGECPIYCFCVSMIYKIIGGAEEYWGRIVTVFSFVAGMMLLYLIVKEYSAERVALISMFVLSVLPIGILYGKSFQPDQLSVTLGLLSLYCIIVWAKGGEKLIYFIISTIFLIISSLTKLTTLSLLFTTLVVIVVNKKRGRLYYCTIHFSLVIASLSLWLMYVYSQKDLLIPAYSDAFSMNKWSEFKHVLSYSYFKEIFLLVSGIVLTPIGFTLLLLGLLLKNERKEEFIFYIWLISSLLPFIILNKKFAPHWFLLPLPVVSYFIGRAIYSMKLISSSITSNLYYRCAFTLVVIFCVWGYANSGFSIPQGAQNTMLISQLVKEKTEPNDILCTDGAKYLMYYLDRKGYLIWQSKTERDGGEDSEDIFVSEIEGLKKKGVNYLIITRVQQYKAHQFLKKYIEGNCKLIKEEKDICLIYKLQS